MKLDFEKGNGILPAVIQDNNSLQVLMLGYMNIEAFDLTQRLGKVTFFSRSKNRIWTKGETSGNYLEVVDISSDCDNDSILILANPKGPTCHIGSVSCFNYTPTKGFLYELEKTIDQRIDNKVEESYTNQLYNKGINKVAQKVGEEAIELVIESKDQNDVLFKNEAADLLYHFLILLKAKNISLEAIEEELRSRSA